MKPVNVSSHLSAMLVPTYRSPANYLARPLTIRTSPYACAANNIPGYLLLVAQALAFIQMKSGIFSKNGVSYEYHYDFNQLTALYLKMLAPKGRLSLHSKDDCIASLVVEV